ncbi:MAG: outer membrane beta-barrel protein [Spirochaetes bacterium]|nr:outer membrane beta-barrel protein [Spirochaetota bacterium]
MKKTSILIVFLIFLIGVNSYASVKAGLWGGYNMIFENYEGQTNISKGHIAFGIKATYDMNLFKAGLLVSYMPLVDSEITGATNTSNFSQTDIPMIVFGQINFDAFYVLVGAGLHLAFSKTTINQEATKETEVNLGLALGTGYEIDLGKWSIDAGVLFHMLMFEKESTEILTFHAGVNYSL